MKVFDQSKCCPPDANVDRILTTCCAVNGTYQVLIDFNGNVLEKGFD